MDHPDKILTGVPAPEQWFEEVSKLLLSVTTVRELVACSPVLAAVIPELEPLIGFDQRSPHHAYDLFTHTAHVVTGVPKDLTLRWAALLHDIGKVPTFTRDETGRGHFYGHAPKGAEMAEEVLLRLKAPDDLRQQAVFLIENHMTRLRPDKEQLRRQLEQLGRENLEQLLILQKTDMAGKGTGKPEERTVFQQVREILEEIRAEDCRGAE